MVLGYRKFEIIEGSIKCAFTAILQYFLVRLQIVIVIVREYYREFSSLASSLSIRQLGQISVEI